MPNRYSVRPLDLSGLEGISKLGDQYRANKRREQFSSDVSQALKSGDYESIQNVMLEYPEAGEVFKNLASFKSDQTRQLYGEGLGSVLTTLEDLREEDEEGNVTYPSLMNVSEDGTELGYDARVQDTAVGASAKLDAIAQNIEKLGGRPMHIREAQQLLAEGKFEEAYNQARTGLMMGNPDLYSDRYGTVGDMADMNKVGARKIFQNGTILQSTPRGQVVWKDGKRVPDDKIQETIDEANDFEEQFYADKARSKTQATQDVKGATEPQIQSDITREKSRSEQMMARHDANIAAGLEGSKGIANLKRGLTLLKRAATGGYDRAKLAAKQFFGIESADEAELSNRMGKAVLAQLRETFGAAFTAKEGESLKVIEANYGKSTEGNKRLLNQALQLAMKAAKRGIKSAEAVSDFETADQIREYIDFEFTDGTESVGDLKYNHPKTNYKGWVLMEDDQGNMAHVNPEDPNQYEEVR